METANRRDGAYDLLRLQRRSAASHIPREQELRCDLGIDAVPQQVSGQGGDAVVALTLANALPAEGGASERSGVRDGPVPPTPHSASPAAAPGGRHQGSVPTDRARRWRGRTAAPPGSRRHAARPLRRLHLRLVPRRFNRAANALARDAPGAPQSQTNHAGHPSEVNPDAGNDRS